MGESGRGLTFWKKIKFFKNEGGEEYQTIGNFIHPWTYVVVSSAIPAVTVVAVFRFNEQHVV